MYAFILDETNKKNQQEERQNETFINSVNKNQILIIPKKSRSSQQQSSSSLEQLSIATCMDLLLTGKVMSWNTGYIDVRMKILNSNITPQNRLILCRSPYNKKYQSNNNIFDMTKCHNVSTIISEEVKINSSDTNVRLNPTAITVIPSSSLIQQKLDNQHRKLQIAYKKAHLVQPPKPPKQKTATSPFSVTSASKTAGNVAVSEAVCDLSTIKSTTVRIPRLFIGLFTLLLLMCMIISHVQMNLNYEQQMLSQQLTTIFDGFNKISSDSSHEQQPYIFLMIGLLLGMMIGILIGRNNVPTTKP